MQLKSPNFSHFSEIHWKFTKDIPHRENITKIQNNLMIFPTERGCARWDSPLLRNTLQNSPVTSGAHA